MRQERPLNVVSPVVSQDHVSREDNQGVQRERTSRSRVAVMAPARVLAVTAGIARREITTISQTAAALQMLGLVRLLIANRDLQPLRQWRQPTSNPRVPFLLGMPQSWLEAVDLLQEERDFLYATAHIGAALGTLKPVVFPDLRRAVYDTQAAWHAGAREAARHLRVPAGHLLGLLQTVGALVYAAQYGEARRLFDANARTLARNNQDLYNLDLLPFWADIAGPLLSLSLAMARPTDDAQRVAVALSQGRYSAARQALDTLRLGQVRITF